MRCKNVLEFANLSGRKENKTLLMHLPESGHWSFDKEGFFDTENLMHPEPASGGVLLIVTKAKRYNAGVKLVPKWGVPFRGGHSALHGGQFRKFFLEFDSTFYD